MKITITDGSVTRAIRNVASVRHTNHGLMVTYDDTHQQHFDNHHLTGATTVRPPIIH